MANRVSPLTQIETLSGNIPAQTYFDNNIGPVFNAVNDSSLGWVNYQGTDTGSANNYIISASFGTPSAYNAGMTVTFKPGNTNTGASTITVSPLASVPIQHGDGTACIGGEIQAGKVITLEHNGTAFLIIGPPFLYGTTVYYDYDEFVFFPTGGAVGGTSKLFSLTAGGNGTVGFANTSGHPGIINITCGTTTSKCTVATSLVSVFLDAFTYTLRAIIQTSATIDTNVGFFGLAVNAGVNPFVAATNPCIAFSWSSGSSFLQMATGNGTTQTFANTTQSVTAATFYDLMIVCSASSATFYVNGTQVGTTSTTLPSSSTLMQYAAGMQAVSGTTRGIAVDLMEILITGIPVLSGSTNPRFLHGLV